ncbi:unnamed protein product [Musa textilis]
MKIVTLANARTTLEARKGVGMAIVRAFRSDAVMGFLKAANGLFVLYISIILVGLNCGDDWEGLYESMTGYDLGGSLMPLFGRVGGGIYTQKHQTVVLFLLEKLLFILVAHVNFHMVVILILIDNEEDIAGMGSDLFASYAESSCAALSIASISSFGINHDMSAMLYPFLMNSLGIVVCMVPTLLAAESSDVKTVPDVQPSLKWQLLISTVLLTLAIAFVSFVVLPSNFTLFNFRNKKNVKNW